MLYHSNHHQLVPLPTQAPEPLPERLPLVMIEGLTSELRRRFGSDIGRTGTGGSYVSWKSQRYDLSISITAKLTIVRANGNIILQQATNMFHPSQQVATVINALDAVESI